MREGTTSTATANSRAGPWDEPSEPYFQFDMSSVTIEEEEDEAARTEITGPPQPQEDPRSNGGGGGDQQEAAAAAADDDDDDEEDDTEAQTQQQQQTVRRLMKMRPIPLIYRLPNTAFGVCMGLAGNAILWKTASGQPGTVLFQHSFASTCHAVLWYTALVAAVLVSLAHVYKAVYKWPLVQAELHNNIRVHFYNGPHLVLIMLALGVPQSASSESLRVVFGIALFLQTAITQTVYDQWLFEDMSSISCAKPPFLLSTVGWFLLAVLGHPAEIEQQWGLSIPQFCFGVGSVFYLMVVFAIFNHLHQVRHVFRGSPSLTLLMAPPSVAVVALDNFNKSLSASSFDANNGGSDESSAPVVGQFSLAASFVLGWIFILFVLLGKIGPRIATKPAVFGEYWAYVFPLAAVATAWLRYASVVGTRAAEVVGMFFLAFASLALVLVVCRMTYHTTLCVLGKANWGDPLLMVDSSRHSVRYPLEPTLQRRPSDNNFRDDSMFLQRSNDTMRGSLRGDDHDRSHPPEPTITVQARISPNSSSGSREHAPMFFRISAMTG